MKLRSVNSGKIVSFQRYDSWKEIIKEPEIQPFKILLYNSRSTGVYFYDKEALLMEERIPRGILDSIGENTKEYSIIASVARYYNFDDMTKKFIERHPKCNIINLGVGLDTFANRIERPDITFFQIDFEETMNERKLWLKQLPNEVLISGDIFKLKWTDEISDKSLPTLMLAAGVFQYFHEEEILTFLKPIKGKFPSGEIIFDCTNTTGIKYAQKYVKKTGNTSAMMYFAVDNPKDIADKCEMELVDYRVFYTQARKQLKRRTGLYTRIAMRVCDNGHRAHIVHLKLNRS